MQDGAARKGGAVFFLAAGALVPGFRMAQNPGMMPTTAGMAGRIQFAKDRSR